jgi:hypothetical protein
VAQPGTRRQRKAFHATLRRNRGAHRDTHIMELKLLLMSVHQVSKYFPARKPAALLTCSGTPGKGSKRREAQNGIDKRDKRLLCRRCRAYRYDLSPLLGWAS